MRITPWINKNEFEQVFECIFSSNVAKKRWALARIQCWKSRCRIPLAVQATFDFVEIQLQDQFQRMSDNSLRLLYSMAMIRFVNGIIDQAQGSAAKSMTGMADMLGLPTWFVELRHSATHDQLPSMELVRNATHQALDWIYTHYWSCQYSISKLELIDFFHRLKDLDKNSRDKMLVDFMQRVNDGSELLIIMDALLETDYGSFGMWDDAFKLFEKEWKGFSKLIFKRVIQNFGDFKLRSYEKWALWLIERRFIKDDHRFILDLLAKSQISDFTIMLYKKLIANSPALQQTFGPILAFSNQINLEYCNFSQSVISGELHEIYQRIQQVDSLISSNPKSTIDIPEKFRWQKATEYKWDAPIGFLPDGSIPNLDLDLDDESNCK